MTESTKDDTKKTCYNLFHHIATFRTANERPNGSYPKNASYYYAEILSTYGCDQFVDFSVMRDEMADFNDVDKSCAFIKKLSVDDTNNFYGECLDTKTRELSRDSYKLFNKEHKKLAKKGMWNISNIDYLKACYNGDITFN